MSNEKMLSCEGYKMFEGTATVTPKNSMFAPMILCGVWLYRPDTRCWYCGGRSFPEEIVSNFKEAKR